MSNNKQSILNEEFVPYEESLELKELRFPQGFTNDGIWYYVTLSSGKIHSFCWTSTEDEPPKMFNPIIRPTFSQAFKWFRDNFGLSGWVDESFTTNIRIGVVSVKSPKGLEYIKSPKSTMFFETYEEAELACLRKLIEIVKGGNNDQQ